MDKHSSEYDNCGVFTYWRDNPTTVLPSLEWENAYEFFKEVKPPLFEDYEIVIVTEGDDCFNDAGKLGLMAFLMIFIAI